METRQLLYFTGCVMKAPPGFTLVHAGHSGAEIRIVAENIRLMENLRLNELAKKLKSADTEDPFWDRLVDQAVPAEEFEAEFLRHLGITEHPKGALLVRLARRNSDDLQDAYLLALDLLDLIC